ncbi:uncharacterized protein LOC131944344 [Physella acuta]|uniref:uncharacterized protein LOC131944344 n=1 Tax=Physella acuta TaxID=109671 RepID=UPI0027DD3781|nr:uncharacterized protein LOC131944344 [Physella acuta]
MPPKRKSIGRSTSEARTKRAIRASETDEQRESRLESIRVGTAQTRSNETEQQHESRLETVRLRTAQARSNETEEQRESRLESNRVGTAQTRSNETEQQHESRLETVRLRTAQARSNETEEQRESRLESNRVGTAQTRSNETEQQHESRLETVRLRTAQARSNETEEQRESRLESNRVGTAQTRSNETEQQHESRLETDRLRTAQARSNETEEQRASRLESNRVGTAQTRSNETEQQHESRLETDRLRTAQARSNETEEQRASRLESNRVGTAQTRSNETEQQHESRLETVRLRTAQARSNETEEQRESRLESNRVGTAQTRSNETEQQHESRLETVRLRTAQARSNETGDQRRERLGTSRERNFQNRRTLHADLNLSAFSYDPDFDYSLHRGVAIGKMDKVCEFCYALKFKNETPGMCCASGKVKLPELHLPPELLSTLVSGETSQSKHFLENIRRYNSSFQMTSFGASAIIRDNYMPTFKMQDQIYHRVGSLLPLEDADHKFLQIYFMGSPAEQVKKRCLFNTSTNQEIIAAVQAMFDQHNELVRLFRTALDRMPADEYAVVIRADKTPVGQHERQYNAPTLNEVAIVIAGEEFNSRDIIFHRRNGNVQRVCETHRSYDALQYPIIFWQGEDGYHFNIKMINPETNEEINKKVSAMKYYAYRLMIRENQENHILKCRQLFHQYIVDMYAKIESERLLFIRLNQTKLRSEEYIHLRDAITTDANPNDIGKMVILPATFTGSPRHLHEYAQDAMTYVRNYGRVKK